MMPPETFALVTALRLAYRNALVAQATREDRYRVYKDADRASLAAWAVVHGLQQRLMEGTDND